MTNAELIIGTAYFVVDIVCMIKYIWQMQSLRKAKRAVGIARKYFVAALIREVFALAYGIVLCKFVLISLAIISFVLNAAVLLLVINYKVVPKKDWEWDDTIYDKIRRLIKDWID